MTNQQAALDATDAAAMQSSDYWYTHRQELEPGQVFLCADVSVVRLDTRVPGDGTKWSVDDWDSGSWFCCGTEIEPGDLRGRPLEDTRQAIEAAIAAHAAQQQPERSRAG